MTTPADPSPSNPGIEPGPPSLEAHLRAGRAEGRKLLLPYVTGGYPIGEWPQLIEGFAAAGADAIEIGIPFSDPVMDGPTIQEASTIALEAGSNPMAVLAEVAKTDPGIPLIAMTYYNICYRMGHERFASSLRQAGISAAILPDLPLEEVGDWADVADTVGIETVLLAAPTAPDERLPRIVERARGFVYGVGLVGVTGERAELAASAVKMATRLKAITDKPVIIGVGVSNPEQAAEICQVADGVVVASAIIRQMLEGGSIDQAIEYVGALRRGLDGG
ncbi:MAG: tryptophan synthase subunit alpha [Actinomycetia bacterium]|nr:tryptophan synthase subunit alpha [Actinomycetes bacterium]